MATISSIRTVLFTVASEFKTTDVDKLATIDENIALYKDVHNEEVLGGHYSLCIANLVAFHLKNQGFTVAVTPVAPVDTVNPNKVIFKKAKNMELRYSDNTVKRTQTVKDIYDLNNYGQMYKYYLSLACVGPFVI